MRTSAISSPDSSSGTPCSFITTSPALSPALAAGPPADTAGNIGLAFAIPINQARRVAQEIVDTGHARRTVIGAELSASYQNPNGGVEITSVSAGGPAANAGLKAGDVVTKLQGIPLEESGELIALVRKYSPGTSVTVDYQRDGAPHTAQVTLASDSK